MIERVYLKNHLTFKEVELSFQRNNGLMVFTGPSGAGKSVLIQGILAIFAYFDANAELSEALIDDRIDLEEYGIEVEDEIIFRQIKKEKTRYFINSQVVSKKTAKKLASNFIDYLSFRNTDEFKNDNLLKVLDKFSGNHLKSYGIMFSKYQQLKDDLCEIQEKERKAEELKEFLNYEIDKIEKLAPKEGEFEELMDIKKNVSKIEKLKELIFGVAGIFNFETKVIDFLNEIEVDTTFFDETMNELRNYIDMAEQKAEFLENIDVDEVLDRLQNLQNLIKRFGSISESLIYLENKKQEFFKLENISFEKEKVEKKIEKLESELLKKAEVLHRNREKGIKIFEDKLNIFLEDLYMPKAKLILEKTKLNKYGIDEVKIEINGNDISLLSAGEFNRLRLAFLASKIDFEEKPKALFLDEIDANLSGEESMSVADVIKFLSRKYQIFAISHQPQLTSKADKHFFVGKEDNISFVKELNENERIEEIARIISGKDLSEKALTYAKELLNKR